MLKDVRTGPGPSHSLSPAAGGGALGGSGGGSRPAGLYRCTHCADCELRLGGHDVCGLDVAVVHWVLKCGPDICVLVASIAIERNFGSSPGNERERTDSGLKSDRGRGRQREGREDSGHSSGKLWVGWGRACLVALPPSCTCACRDRARSLQ